MSERNSNIGFADLLIISVAFIVVGILLFMQDAELDERLTRIETILEITSNAD